MTWTDERVEKLKIMWEAGMSASKISNELGEVTRNAVIGKVHRLGLAGTSNRRILDKHQSIIVSTPLELPDEYLDCALICMTIVVPGSANWLNQVVDQFGSAKHKNYNVTQDDKISLFDHLALIEKNYHTGELELPFPPDGSYYPLENKIATAIEKSFDNHNIGIYFGSIEALTKGLLEGGANGVKVWARMGKKTYAVGLARLSGCIFILMLSASGGLSLGEELPNAISAIKSVGGDVLQWILDEQPLPSKEQVDLPSSNKKLNI